MSVIEVQGLRKEFGRRVTAIDNLDFAIAGPGVYGFLGPNGSGKTTTIRCLLGLIRPTAGRAQLFGVDVAHSLNDVINRVGALVETPKFFPSFSGRKNLDMLARVAGIPGTEVDRALESVGLGDRGRDRFQTYSLGMKQRLAIAATLLKDPDVIILDEPANGLDPAGIVEIRRLIRSLGASGKTIFVSSHQLAEVQQTCDEVMIISRGRLIRSGPVAEIVALGQAQGLTITITDPAAARAVLAGAGFEVVDGSENGAENTLHVTAGVEQAADINQLLAHNGLFLSGLRTQEASLESVFLELTEGQGGL